MKALAAYSMCMFSKRRTDDTYYGSNVIVADIRSTDDDTTFTIENISRKNTSLPVVVKWGDGQTSSVTGTSVTHTYSRTGKFVIRLDGNAQTFGEKLRQSKAVEMYWAEGSDIGSVAWYPAGNSTRLERAVWITGPSSGVFPQYGFINCTSLCEIGPLDVFTDFSKPNGVSGSLITEAMCVNAEGDYNSFADSCPNLKVVDIGHCTRITGRGFADCASLERIVGIENVTSSSNQNAFYNCPMLTHLCLRSLETLTGVDTFRLTPITEMYLPSLTTTGIACLRQLTACRYVIVPKVSGCTSSTGQMFINAPMCEYFGPFIESGDFGIFGIVWWNDICDADEKTDADGNTYRRVIEFRAMTCAEIMDGSRWAEDYNHEFPYGCGTKSGTKFVGSDGYIMYLDGAWVTRLYEDGYSREDYYVRYLNDYKAKYPEEFSTSSYVQDGLVAQWDVASDTPLRDVIGGLELEGEYAVQFDGAIRPTTSLTCTLHDTVNLAEATVEICGRVTSFSGGYSDSSIANIGGRSIGLHGNISTLRYRKFFDTGYVTVWGGDSVYLGNSTIQLSDKTVAYGSRLNSTMSVNGTEVSSMASTGLTAGGLTSTVVIGSGSVTIDVSAIRIYNRQLSQAELATNALIDHDRFGTGAWRNPYVTDGLLAMWDGEWNVGGGVHNPAAMAWKELVSGTDCAYSLSSAPTWEDKCWRSVAHNDGGFFSAFWPKGFMNDHTIEVIVQKDSGVRGVIMGAYGLPGGNNCNVEWYTGGTFRAYYNNYPNLVSSAGTFPVGTPVHFAARRTGTKFDLVDSVGGVNASDSHTSVYRHALARIGCDSRAEGMCLCGRIYSIRIYSRSLSSEEIAANHAVDKARFFSDDKEVQYTVVAGEAYTYNGVVTSRDDFSRIDEYLEIPSGCVTLTFRWAKTGTSTDSPTPIIAFYRADRNYADYWTFNQGVGQRTVSLEPYPLFRFFRFCFKTSDMDDCFVRDDTHGVYIWKGKNVQ